MLDRNTTPNQPSSTDAHTDLLATIAAARELGPDMDTALAETYMKKHAQAVVRQQPAGPPASYQLLGAVGMVAFTAIIITAIVVMGREAIGLLWLPLVFGGLWFRGMWRGPHYDSAHRAQRDAYHAQRRDLRDQYRAQRYGYGYRDPYYDDDARDQTPPPTRSSNPDMA